ncbi:hypothetical protein KKB40_01530 [Patescibacteria group bacterium]|nr:hypothetical protein [Patescibacteria group bacterium]
MSLLIRSALRIVISVFTKIIATILAFSFMVVLMWFMYRFGYSRGFYEGQIETEQHYLSIMEEAGLEVIREFVEEAVDEKPTSSASVEKTTISYKAEWGGPELWEAVNDKRIEYGVNPLFARDELCTIASIRLNELLTLGTLDNHEGFSNMQERRPDLVWIFDKYSTVAEFLALGGQSAEETVSMWENTLGHKKLLTGGEYVWGCIYAQNTFAVAITAF